MKLTQQQGAFMLGAALSPTVKLQPLTTAVVSQMLTATTASAQTTYETTVRNLQTRIVNLQTFCGNVVPKVTVCLPPNEMSQSFNSSNTTKRSTVGWRAAWATYSIPTTREALRCHIFVEDLFNNKKDELKALLTVQSTMNPAMWISRVLDAVSQALFATNIQPGLLARMMQDGTIANAPSIQFGEVVRPAYFDATAYNLGWLIKLEQSIRATPLFSTPLRSQVNADAPVPTQMNAARQWADFIIVLPFAQTIGAAVLSWIKCSAYATGMCNGDRIPVSPPDFAALQSKAKKLDQALALSGAIGYLTGAGQALYGAGKVLGTGDLSSLNDVVSGVETVVNVLKTTPNPNDPFRYVYIADPLFLRTPANEANSTDGSLYDTEGMASVMLGGAIRNLDAAGYTSTANQIKTTIGQVVAAAPTRDVYAATQSSDAAKSFLATQQAAGGKSSIPWAPIAVGGGALVGLALLIKFFR